MKRIERVLNLLNSSLKTFDFEIKDNSSFHVGHNSFDGLGETHLLILIYNKSNEKPNRLEIHKKINNLLKDEFNNGLHSVEIKIN
tara:strand:- start:417 stop:671 length:255 start_codon:yes stop_codon:yes gene_type:complete